MAAMPRVIAAHHLAQRLGDPGIQVVFVGDETVHAQGHIEGATCLRYADLVAVRPPASGLLPDSATLARVLAEAGITPTQHVVAYDASGGGAASRLLWTLDCVGHDDWSLLDGGLPAWRAEGLPLVTDTQAARAEVPPYPVDTAASRARADADYIESHLGDPDVVILDARSPGEYRGDDVRAARAGHIPGAVNLDWTDNVNAAGEGRLRPAESLREAYAALGVTPEREVITHCQTHHRSSLSYVVLRWLGFERVRGYDGSWSEWGNDPRRPVNAGSNA